MTDSVETIDSGEDEERQVSWADNSPPMFEAESDTEAAAATEAQARDPVVQVVDLDGPLLNPAIPLVDVEQQDQPAAIISVEDDDEMAASPVLRSTQRRRRARGSEEGEADDDDDVIEETRRSAIAPPPSAETLTSATASTSASASASTSASASASTSASASASSSASALASTSASASTSTTQQRRRGRGEDDGGDADGADEEPPCRKMKSDGPGGFLVAASGSGGAGGGGAAATDADGDADGNDEEDGQTCPVCFDAWSNSGSHRVVSLKCGHLFGQSCIERWIHSAGKSARCPQCNVPALKKDVWPIYVRNLKAIDTTERDRALAALEREKEHRRRVELEYHKLQLQMTAKEQEVCRLQQELQQCRAALSGACLAASAGASASELGCAGLGHQLFGSQPPTILARRLALDCALELCKDGACRVMAYSEYLTLMVVSYAGTNAHLTGTGVKKIQALGGFRACGYIALHRKPIRDMAFHLEQSDLLLTVALDKTAKLANVQNDMAVHTYQCDAPLWSCAWNGDNKSQFFVGTQTGKVLLYDMRKPGDHVDCWTEPNNMSPVTGLAYLPYSAVTSFPRGGLFVQRLQSCVFHEARGAEAFVAHALPLDGPFTSLYVEPETRHFLASSRPTSSHPQTRHTVCAPTWNQIGADATAASAGVCSSQPVASIQAGSQQKFMSRSCLIAVPASTEGKQLLVAAHQESAQCVTLWDVNSSAVLHKLPVAEPVLDVAPLRVNGVPYLAALSDKHVRFYKWT